MDMPESTLTGTRLWGRWIAANALGELLGLGLIGLVVGGVASRSPSSIPSWVILPGVLLLGMLEGVLVGLCQGWVLREALPHFRMAVWIRATAAGALLAWVLGVLPSTLMDMGGASSTPQNAPAEPSQWVQWLLAAALGVVAGPILSGVQWFVLRRHVARAGWWIPANSLAWAVGMPLVFIAVGTAAETGSLTLRGALFALGIIAAAGSVVGMIHGLVLVRLLKLDPPWKVVRAPAGPRPRWLSIEFKALGVLELLISLSALSAGALFVARPSGSLMGVTEALLKDSPFHSFLIPGLVLGLVLGGGFLLAAVLSLRGHALAELVSLLAGLVLVGWISLQMAFIGYWPPLQPVLFCLGLLIMAGGLLVMEQRARLLRE